MPINKGIQENTTISRKSPEPPKLPNSQIRLGEEIGRMLLTFIIDIYLYIYKYISIINVNNILPISSPNLIWEFGSLGGSGLFLEIVVFS